MNEYSFTRLIGNVRGAILVIVALCVFTACDRAKSNKLQGYIEGEFIYVSSPLPGTLHKLHAVRGGQVRAGEALFELEATAEKAGRDEAERRLMEARANLEDAKKGKRPSEISSIEAQLGGAQTAFALSEKELNRQETLKRSGGATAEQDVDRAKSARDQDRHRVEQLRAELETAHLGGRPDQIRAAEAKVSALEAMLTKAEWELSQKNQQAPNAGLVFDTLYREGEWVAAGRPVVSLLPPANVKLRVFVPETRIGSLQFSNAVQVFVDGVDSPVIGKISFISPRAEYTPPVIFSRENRSKFVFLVEATFEPAVAEKLHPGQPVDVEFGPAR